MILLLKLKKIIWDTKTAPQLFDYYLTLKYILTSFWFDKQNPFLERLFRR